MRDTSVQGTGKVQEVGPRMSGKSSIFPPAEGKQTSTCSTHFTQLVANFEHPCTAAAGRKSVPYPWKGEREGGEALSQQGKKREKRVGRFLVTLPLLPRDRRAKSGREREIWFILGTSGIHFGQRL